MCRQQAGAIGNHENVNVRNIVQGEEPQHRKYKRLKLDGDQLYERSTDQAAVVT
jgi:hypothetical protein